MPSPTPSPLRARKNGFPALEKRIIKDVEATRKSNEEVQSRLSRSPSDSTVTAITAPPTGNHDESKNQNVSILCEEEPSGLARTIATKSGQYVMESPTQVLEEANGRLKAVKEARKAHAVMISKVEARLKRYRQLRGARNDTSSSSSSSLAEDTENHSTFAERNVTASLAVSSHGVDVPNSRKRSAATATTEMNSEVADFDNRGIAFEDPSNRQNSAYAASQARLQESVAPQDQSGISNNNNQESNDGAKVGSNRKFLGAKRSRVGADATDDVPGSGKVSAAATMTNCDASRAKENKFPPPPSDKQGGSVRQNSHDDAPVTDDDTKEVKHDSTPFAASTTNEARRIPAEVSPASDANDDEFDDGAMMDMYRWNREMIAKCQANYESGTKERANIVDLLKANMSQEMMTKYLAMCEEGAKEQAHILDMAKANIEFGKRCMDSRR